MLEAEREVFAREQFAALRPDMVGLPTLVDAVVSIQERAINSQVPTIKKNLIPLMNRLGKELAQIHGSCTTPMDRRLSFTRALSHVEARLRRFVSATELPADAGYHLACHVQEKIDLFGERLEQSMPKILTVEYSERVLYYVNETRGATLPNLWSNPVFRLLVCEAFGVNCDNTGRPDALFSAGAAADDACDGFTSNLMRFAVQLCDEVYEYVESLIENLLWDEIGDEFPNLAVSLKDEARGMMMGARDKITEVIESYISAEESILYTQNHDYMAQIRERSAVLKRQLTAQLSVEHAKKQNQVPHHEAAGGAADDADEGGEAAAPEATSGGEGAARRAARPTRSRACPSRSSRASAARACPTRPRRPACLVPSATPRSRSCARPRGTCSSRCTAT